MFVFWTAAFHIVGDFLARLDIINFSTKSQSRMEIYFRVPGGLGVAVWAAGACAAVGHAVDSSVARGMQIFFRFLSAAWVWRGLAKIQVLQWLLAC